MSPFIVIVVMLLGGLLSLRAVAQSTDESSANMAEHTIYLHLTRSLSGALSYELSPTPSISDGLRPNGVNMLWETIRSQEVDIHLHLQTNVPSLSSASNLLDRWNVTQITMDSTVHTTAVPVGGGGANGTDGIVYVTSNPQLSMDTFISESSRQAGFTSDRAFPSGHPFAVLCNETLEVAAANSTNCTPSVLRIRLGKTHSFRLWRLTTLTELIVPLTWLTYYSPVTVSVRGQTSATEVNIPILFTTNIPSSIRKNTVFALCCAIGVGSIITGGGGWVGLTSLQTLIVSVGGSKRCAEPFTDYYFDGLYRVLVAPTSFTNEDIEFSQVLTVGIIMFCLLAHGLAATLKAKISGTGFWSAARWCYFPMPFLISVTYLWIHLSAQTFSGVSATDQSPLIQVSFALSWLVVVIFTAYVWFGALATGHDGFYSITPLPQVLRLADSHSQINKLPKGGKPDQPTHSVLVAPVVAGMYRAFGRVAWLFIPEGSWPLTRGFGVCRGLFRDATCSFATFTLIFLCVIASVSNATSCSALYINTATVQSIYLAIFLLFRPFRVPLLNLVWIIIKGLEIAVNIMLNHFLNNNFDGNVTDAIPAIATVIIGLNAFFVFYALIVTFFERSARNRERLVKMIRYGTIREGGGGAHVASLQGPAKDDPEYLRFLAEYNEQLSKKNR